MGSYKLTLDAKEDLQRIYNYGFVNWGEIQADKYFNAFFDCFDEIADNPSLYQSVEHIRKGYRRCVCGIDNIYYHIVENEVEIVNILGTQNFEKDV